MLRQILSVALLSVMPFIDIGLDVSFQGCPSPQSLCYARSFTYQIVVNGQQTIDSQELDKWGHSDIPLGYPEGSDVYWWIKPERALAVRSHEIMSGYWPVGFFTYQGDADENNAVGAPDFTILHGTMGKCAVDPGYDGRADFTGDMCVSTLDFIALKNGYGRGGDPMWPVIRKGAEK